jgi:hypothetical protein
MTQNLANVPERNEQMGSKQLKDPIVESAGDKVKDAEQS